VTRSETILREGRRVKENGRRTANVRHVPLTSDVRDVRAPRRPYSPITADSRVSSRPSFMNVKRTSSAPG
jgi:hypothetical protein